MISWGVVMATDKRYAHSLGPGCLQGDLTCHPEGLAGGGETSFNAQEFSIARGTHSAHPSRLLVTPECISGGGE